MSPSLGRRTSVGQRTSASATISVGLASLLAGLAAVMPASAPASSAHVGHVSAHRVRVARSLCATGRPKGSRRSAASVRARRRAHSTCVHPASKRPAGAGHVTGPLEAVPLTGANGGAQSTPPLVPAPQGTRGPTPRVPSPKIVPGTSKGEPLPIESGEVVNHPIDARFLTADPFGTTSFWLQPWRAYLDTWPASRLLESVGINFNVRVANAEATARLLEDSGFKLARVAINWSSLSYEDPTSFIPNRLRAITARLTALRNHGLRPLIVLDAYSGAPTPAKHVVLETVAAAPAGALSVRLAPASAAQVVPGKTGFNSMFFEGAPDLLITSVSASGVATLARPLPIALGAGAHGATTLLYAPFGPPKLANGQPNPEFQATLAGWLNYVSQAAKAAASVVGPGGFDFEIWNELTFSSQFLNSENYYASGAPGPVAAAGRGAVAAGLAPSGGSRTDASAGSAGNEASGAESEEGESNLPPARTAGAEAAFGSEPEANQEVEQGPEEEGARPDVGEIEPGAAAASVVKSRKHMVTKEVIKAIRNSTVAFVRDPANGMSPAVGITDGFASETPFPSGAAAPIGLTALSKHPYVSARRYPAEYREQHDFPLNAQGTRDTLRGSFAPLFTPTYQTLLPEYTLTANSTETLIRDLAPFTTTVYHFPHGRNVAPAGGSPVQKWITEYNLAPGKATVMGPDEVTAQTGPSATLSAADKAHFQAKALLRSLVAMVNKGISREYFFAAAPGALSLVSSDFYAALEANPETFPGDQLGGETLSGFRNMLARFQGPGPNGAARQIQLQSIAQDGSHAQFKGDGTAAHPDLYDRDVLAVLPFQSSPTRFVIPVYVMTRDLLTLYEPGSSAGDITRFDLPSENFRITLANLPQTAQPPAVSAYDPLKDQATPARLLTREGTTATFEIAATDYPRLLTIDYPGE